MSTFKSSAYENMGLYRVTGSVMKNRISITTPSELNKGTNHVISRKISVVCSG